jgi:tRNA-dihydrouridine synthase B
MFKVGDYEFNSQVLLAPMAGTSDKPFRILAKNFGAALATSEMVLLKDGLLKTDKSKYRLDFSGEQNPISLQIAGSNADEMANYAKKAQDFGADIIDINMGCPAKKVCNKASGSALLQDEKLVADILQSVVESADIPVTLKMRTGWNDDNKNYLTIAKIAEDLGVQMLAIHGRTRENKYQGEAEYQSIKEVVENVSIPVIANGDINSPEKARDISKKTGCAGIMIGRASQGQPWIIKQIDDYLKTGRYQDFDKKQEIILQHIDDIYNFYPEIPADNIAKKHIKWYLYANNLGDFWQEIYPIKDSKKRREKLQNILNNNFI